MNLAAILIALGSVIAGLVAVFFGGKRSERRDAALEKAEADKATRERIDHAPVSPDADAAREWLRNRKP